MAHLGGTIRPAILIGAAILFRLTAFWMPPHFTDDLYRYRWEARTALAGVNPYSVNGYDARVAHLRDEYWEKLDGKDFKPVYGPLLETVQVAAYRVGGGSLRGMKVGACLAEAILAWLLWRRLTGWRWALWGWCPLPVVEFWGMGHHDAWTVLFVFGALFAWEGQRFVRAMTLLGLAAATKYWPLLLLPWFARRRPAVAPLALLVLGLCWWPWHTDVSENLRYMGGYIGGWRNNDILFGAILWIAGDYEPAKYAGMLAIAASSLAAAGWARTGAAALATIGLTILLVSASVQPWYLTWLLPLAALTPSWPLALWAALTPILYAVLIRWRAEHVWEGVSPSRWAVYLPVLALQVLQLRDSISLRWRNLRGGNPR